MNGPTVPTLVAVAIQTVLGLAIYLGNPRRYLNQSFLILSLAIDAWLASLYLTFIAKDAATAEFFMRQASVTGLLYLSVLNLLRLSILERRNGWRGIIKRCRLWFVFLLAVAVFCQTDFFIKGARLAQGAEAVAPTPIYNPLGADIYSVCLVAAILVLLLGIPRDLRKTQGGERAELGFVLIGGLGAMSFTLLLTFALDLFIDQSRWIWFAPLRVLIFSVIVAYGISTRKLMEVGILLRRILSYVVLAAYLLVLYWFVWWLVRVAVQQVSSASAQTIAHTVAAIVIAFAMAPARGLSRRLAERLFISTHHLDFRATVSKATAILSSITTLHDLLEQFGGTIAEAVGAERVLILLESREGFTTRFSFVQKTDVYPATCILESEGLIVARLRAHHEPIVADELHRMRRTEEIVRLSGRMQELNIAVAVGISSRERLAGVMLLGPRVSGRIYGSDEQNALTVLCGQLGVAIDNAELFTEVQNARLYNETLLQNLTTGVIATGVDERITVFNNEAGQILQVQPFEVLDQSVHILPDPLRLALCATLRSGQAQNAELTLQTKDEGITVRISTSIFRGQNNQVLGALMVLTDVTALKRLEMQIRRSDRLASLGTLSAGMAHEIKNPLVSIKTFAQLLPERYNDSDFRDTFSNLIGHEIDRIDSLVNQLLRFARPAKPHLQPSHVHAILEKSLLLVGHRLYQKDIKLTRFWEATVDTIRADADQLEQVFLNFFINAMDAMKNGGELSISTEVLSNQEWLSHLPNGDRSNGSTGEVLRITIRDNGEGIRSENLAHVFDPFFTTKDYGTGLGLSVVHGIVQEHGGQIEVESELHKGTAFHILLPLVRFGSEVVAA